MSRGEVGQLTGDTDPFCTACDGQTSGDIASNTANTPQASAFFSAWNGHGAGTGFVDGFFSMFFASINY